VLFASKKNPSELSELFEFVEKDNKYYSCIFEYPTNFCIILLIIKYE
jgi:hypothetical protein